MEWHEFDIELAEVVLADITSVLPKDHRQLNAKGQKLVRQHHELEIAVDMWHRFGNLDINPAYAGRTRSGLSMARESRAQTEIDR